MSNQIQDYLALFVLYTGIIWLCGIACAAAWLGPKIWKHKRLAELYKRHLDGKPTK